MWAGNLSETADSVKINLWTYYVIHQDEVGGQIDAGGAGRCITAARSLPGSWDAERQVHTTQVHRQEGSFNAQKTLVAWVMVQDSWEADT